jgi:hypothetical protein
MLSRRYACRRFRQKAGQQIEKAGERIQDAAKGDNRDKLQSAR